MQTLTDPIPFSPGMLVVGGETAGCPVCGWSGVPTILEGVVSAVCPSCQQAPATDEEYAAGSRPRPRRVSRNAPCPCGSGQKAKKCPCVEYAV